MTRNPSAIRLLPGVSMSSLLTSLTSNHEIVVGCGRGHRCNDGGGMKSLLLRTWSLTPRHEPLK